MNHRRTGRRPARPVALVVAAAAALAAGSAAVPLLGATAAPAARVEDHHPATMGLLLADEFDGTELDRGTWCTRYQYGGGAALQSGYQDAACGKDGAGTLDFLNDEKQRYRDVNSKGVPLHAVRDGVLSLTATKTGTGGAPYESAMIRSKLELRPDARTSYYLTSRVKLPSVKGSWPAFWLAPGMRNGASQWPPELDIFEGALNENGDDANMLHMASHGTKASGGTTFNASNFDAKWGNLQQPGSIRDQWHEVGFEWTATSACWFFDGTKVHCEKYSWVDDDGAAANPSPVLLNLAVGGNWAGRNGIDDARFPMSFDVDHVRVYSSAVPPGQQPSTPAPSTPASSTPAPSTPAPSTPAGGSGSGGNAAGMLLRSNASGLCLTPGRTGAAATVQPCADQRWTTTSAGQLKADGKCLAALGRRLRDGTPVGLQACNGSAAQKWRAMSDGSWINAASGRCLDVEGQKTAAGTTLQLWTFKGQANQRWTPVGGGGTSGTPTPAVTPTSPAPSTPGPSTGGRRFLLGFLTGGNSEITSFRDYLGYHPEVTYNSSYQDDHHKTCGQPISGLDELNGYPVMASVFTVNGDFAGSARGRYDSCYEKVFAGLAAKAGSIYGVRIDVEFWPHPAASDFKASFDRIVSIAKKHLPARVKYIFNPNWESGLGAGYVPASADVIGPDAYNNPQWCKGKTGAQCAADKFDPDHAGSIAYWTTIAQQLGKPMALPEWGDDFGDGAYIDKVADWAYDRTLVTPGRSNNVVYLGYWDSNYTEDAHLRGTAKTVFRNRFGTVPYTGTFWGSLLPTTSFATF